MSAIAESTSAGSLARTRTLLEGLTATELQIQAPLAVDRLRLKGLDVSTGFEEVIERSVAALENATAGTPFDDLLRATSVIRRAKVTWSDRAASALDHAAAVVGDEGARTEIRDTARVVRARVLR